MLYPTDKECSGSPNLPTVMEIEGIKKDAVLEKKKLDCYILIGYNRHRKV